MAETSGEKLPFTAFFKNLFDRKPREQIGPTPTQDQSLEDKTIREQIRQKKEEGRTNTLDEMAKVSDQIRRCKNPIALQILQEKSNRLSNRFYEKKAKEYIREDDSNDSE